MLLHRRTSKPAPPPVPGIEGKDCVKFLGITFHKDLCNWDVHIDSFLSGAVSRPYILRVCKYYGYTKDQLGALFQSLIIGFFSEWIRSVGLCLSIRSKILLWDLHKTCLSF